MDKKQYLYVFLTWIIVCSFLYFQYLNPNIFGGNIAQIFREWGIIKVLIIFTLITLWCVIITMPKFKSLRNFLYIPLWGVKKEISNGKVVGYDDESMRKHPKLVIFLLVIVFIFWLSLICLPLFN